MDSRSTPIGSTVREANIFRQLVACSGWLATRGICNCLINNAHWLFASTSTKLHRITRRAPFTWATLADDVVTIVSSEPFTTNEEE